MSVQRRTVYSSVASIMAPAATLRELVWGSGPNCAPALSGNGNSEGSVRVVRMIPMQLVY